MLPPFDNGGDAVRERLVRFFRESKDDVCRCRDAGLGEQSELIPVRIGFDVRALDGRQGWRVERLQREDDGRLDPARNELFAHANHPLLDVLSVLHVHGSGIAALAFDLCEVSRDLDVALLEHSEVRIDHEDVANPVIGEPVDRAQHFLQGAHDRLRAEQPPAAERALERAVSIGLLDANPVKLRVLRHEGIEDALEIGLRHPGQIFQRRTSGGLDESVALVQEADGRQRLPPAIAAALEDLDKGLFARAMDREIDERIAPMEGFDFPRPIVPRDLRTTTDDERRGPFAFERFGHRHREPLVPRIHAEADNVRAAEMGDRISDLVAPKDGQEKLVRLRTSKMPPGICLKNPRRIREVALPRKLRVDLDAPHAHVWTFRDAARPTPV